MEGKLRIGNAERSVLVALAHAAVLAEKETGVHFGRILFSTHLSLVVAGKKWSQEKLATRLTEGAEIVKAVYRYTFRTFAMANMY